ncbi:DUF268 domain-containing protein [Geomonas sp. Red276]
MVKRYLWKLYNGMVLFGFDPMKTLATCRALPVYYRELAEFKRQAQAAGGTFHFGELWPLLHDRSSESGVASGPYFHQDLLVARRVLENNPQRHVDIGSRVDGFVAHVATFREIEVFDIRPLENRVPNIHFSCVDLMSPMEERYRECCDSLSSLHAVEHFGLGRYGDPINYNGYLDGINNMGQALKRGGKFYFSVPMGPLRVEFNAHRVFSLRFLLDLFAPNYRVDRFNYVDDRGLLHENVTLTDAVIADNCGCRCGCAIFEMTKL